MIQEVLTQTAEKLSRVLAAKNADYSGPEEFGNFDRSAARIRVTPEAGIFLRFSDKIERLEHLLMGAEAQVKDESIEDTIDDAIGYLVILKARRRARVA